MLTVLSRKELHQRLRRFIDQSAWSVRVTFSDGQMVFGDLHLDTVALENVAPERVYYAPSPGQGRTATWAFYLEPFELFYNTGAGTIYGRAWIANVPPEFVSDIEPIGWGEHLLSQGVKNIPNPLARLIEAHNQKVFASLNVEPGGYVECALATDHIAEKGITFTRPEIIYADYSYFERLQSTTFTVGLLGTGAEVTLGTSSMVLAALESSIGAKLVLPSDIVREYGFIEVDPAGTSTQLEGEDWDLFFLAKQFPRMSERVPILFKRRAVAYPREFWPYIQSSLVVVGERRQIPYSHGLEAWDEIITARAVGFIGTSS